MPEETREARRAARKAARKAARAARAARKAAKRLRTPRQGFTGVLPGQGSQAPSDLSVHSSVAFEDVLNTYDSRDRQDHKADGKVLYSVITVDRAKNITYTIAPSEKKLANNEVVHGTTYRPNLEAVKEPADRLALLTAMCEAAVANPAAKNFDIAGGTPEEQEALKAALAAAIKLTARQDIVINGVLFDNPQVEVTKSQSPAGSRRPSVSEIGRASISESNISSASESAVSKPDSDLLKKLQEADFERTVEANKEPVQVKPVNTQEPPASQAQAAKSTRRDRLRAALSSIKSAVSNRLEKVKNREKSSSDDIRPSDVLPVGYPRRKSTPGQGEQGSVAPTTLKRTRSLPSGMHRASIKTKITKAELEKLDNAAWEESKNIETPDAALVPGSDKAVSVNSVEPSVSSTIPEASPLPDAANAGAIPEAPPLPDAANAGAIPEAPPVPDTVALAAHLAKKPNQVVPPASVASRSKTPTPQQVDQVLVDRMAFIRARTKPENDYSEESEASFRYRESEDFETKSTSSIPSQGSSVSSNGPPSPPSVTPSVDSVSGSSISSVSSEPEIKLAHKGIPSAPPLPSLDIRTPVTTPPRRYKDMLEEEQITLPNDPIYTYNAVAAYKEMARASTRGAISNLVTGLAEQGQVAVQRQSMGLENNPKIQAETIAKLKLDFVELTKDLNKLKNKNEPDQIALRTAKARLKSVESKLAKDALSKLASDSGSTGLLSKIAKILGLKETKIGEIIENKSIHKRLSQERDAQSIEDEVVGPLFSQISALEEKIGISELQNNIKEIKDSLSRYGAMIPESVEEEKELGFRESLFQTLGSFIPGFRNSATAVTPEITVEKKQEEKQEVSVSRNGPPGA